PGRDGPEPGARISLDRSVGAHYYRVNSPTPPVRLRGRPPRSRPCRPTGRPLSTQRRLRRMPSGRPPGSLHRSPPVDIAELKSKSLGELHDLADDLDIGDHAGLRKEDLIFRIEQNLLADDVQLRGEGVLEILPEGYGFLRSPDWSYLYGPDDIYVSPDRKSTRLNS